MSSQYVVYDGEGHVYFTDQESAIKYARETLAGLTEWDEWLGNPEGIFVAKVILRSRETIEIDDGAAGGVAYDYKLVEPRQADV